MFADVESASGGIAGLVSGQMRSWLAGKIPGFDLDDVGPGVHRPTAEHELTFLTDTTRDADTVRYRLREFKSGGEWATTLLMQWRSGRQRAWLSISVEAPEGGRESIPWVARPRLVAGVLDVVDAWDGTAMLRAAPTWLDARAVPDLVQVLIDSRRRGAVLVAGTDATFPRENWSKLITDITRETLGLAATYILDDEATDALRGEIGPRFDVPVGALRTYLPGVALSDVDDRVRHRVLTTRSLVERSTGQLRSILGRAARAQALRVAVPQHARRTELRLVRIETDQVLESLGPTRHAPAASPPPVADDPIVPMSGMTVAAPADREAADHHQVLLLEAVRSVFGPTAAVSPQSIRELSDLALAAGGLRRRESELRSRYESAQDRLAILAEQIAEHEVAAQQSYLEYAVLQEDAQALADRVRHLQQELSRVDRASVAWADLPESAQTTYPQDYQQLLDWFGRLNQVVFTGDDGPTLDLEAHDSLGKCRRKAWDALLCLDDYARFAKEGHVRGSFHQFLTNPPSAARQIPRHHYASGESETSEHNPKFRAARTFPVPAELDSGCRRFMGAHIKLGQLGMITPRMHFLDDVARTGLIYVGYIGRHLVSASTN
ncbi:hypothetical protein [Actinocatenispora comari]|jgi:hypothetical protein|uniref:Uncharacterized protein n=1 Tax=Actinocatenispora comari TaxID=2807577 RepID=A0A8J4AF82_9ACTN|nr:hypothetical protein [Actinocatenispora comari]GIL27543.1 hypothetical protein NUM_27970 [Actinocatenispora comari]